ncbi:hypothetical protein B0H34DRAFT_543248 [Crassisporium funariophilum]|nr:hypothetical protein B0H34DRAFT_543248 [Crassisporium funariophilum]
MGSRFWLPRLLRNAYTHQFFDFCFHSYRTVDHFSSSAHSSCFSFLRSGCWRNDCWWRVGFWVHGTTHIPFVLCSLELAVAMLLRRSTLSRIPSVRWWRRGVEFSSTSSPFHLHQFHCKWHIFLTLLCSYFFFFSLVCSYTNSGRRLLQQLL